MIGPREAKRFVVISIVGSGIIVVIDKARTGEWPEPQLFLGLAVVYVVLGFTSDLAPQPTGYFALLFLVAMFLTRGTFVVEAIETLTGKTQNKGRSKERKETKKPDKNPPSTNHSGFGGGH
jgi:hypothetical protein